MMAIAQKPLFRGHPRPAHRAAGARLRRSADWPLAIQPGPVILCAASACLFYLWGWAQVTQANFRRVQLSQQIEMVRAQNHLISGELIQSTDKNRVEEWARQHGMVQSSGCLYIGGAEKGRSGR